MTSAAPVLEDVALMYDSWRRRLGSALTSGDKDLRWTENPDTVQLVRKAIGTSGLSRDQVQQFLDEVVRGVCISMLSILDGATQLSDEHELSISLDGDDLETGSLHLEFVTHLLNTGRMA